MVGDRKAFGEMMVAGEGRGLGGDRGLGVQTFFRGVVAPGLSPEFNTLA